MMKNWFQMNYEEQLIIQQKTGISMDKLDEIMALLLEE